jgi:hypothetical protein
MKTNSLAFVEPRFHRLVEVCRPWNAQNHALRSKQVQQEIVLWLLVCNRLGFFPKDIRGLISTQIAHSRAHQPLDAEEAALLQWADFQLRWAFLFSVSSVESFRDGVTFPCLVLTHTRVQLDTPINPNPKNVFQKLANLEIALNSLRGSLRLVNIAASDILAGNRTLILGLLFVLRLRLAAFAEAYPGSAVPRLRQFAKLNKIEILSEPKWPPAFVTACGLADSPELQVYAAYRQSAGVVIPSKPSIVPRVRPFLVEEGREPPIQQWTVCAMCQRRVGTLNLSDHQLVCVNRPRPELERPLEAVPVLCEQCGRAVWRVEDHVCLQYQHVDLTYTCAHCGVEIAPFAFGNLLHQPFCHSIGITSGGLGLRQCMSCGAEYLDHHHCEGPAKILVITSEMMEGRKMRVLKKV